MLWGAEVVVWPEDHLGGSAGFGRPDIAEDDWDWRLKRTFQTEGAAYAKALWWEAEGGGLAGWKPEGGGDEAWRGWQGLVGGEKLVLGSGVDLSPCVEEGPSAALGFPGGKLRPACSLR